MFEFTVEAYQTLCQFEHLAEKLMIHGCPLKHCSRVHDLWLMKPTQWTNPFWGDRQGLSFSNK